MALDLIGMENLVLVIMYFVEIAQFLKQIQTVFIIAMTFSILNVLNVNSLECISMNNQECKERPKIIAINNKEPVLYPCSIKVNKHSGSYNNINNPYTKLCIPMLLKK